MTTVTIPKRGALKKVKLHSYAGEWVAFVGGGIIAHNKDLKDLMKEIDVSGFRKKALVFLVPRKDEGPFFEKNKKIIIKTSQFYFRLRSSVVIF